MAPRFISGRQRTAAGLLTTDYTTLSAVSYAGALVLHTDGELYRAQGGTWKRVAGNVALVGPITERATPITLASPASAYAGAIIFGDDGEMYRSDGAAWIPIAARVKAIGPGLAQPVPIALDAAAYEGAWVYGEDGRMYASNGTVWRSTVEVAEEVAFGVIRVLDAPLTVTVGDFSIYPGLGEPLPDPSYQNFDTLGEALQFLAGYTPGPEASQATVVMAFGYVQTEQIKVTGLNLGFVVITSDDTTVNVDVTGFVGDAQNRAIFLEVVGGAAPYIFCNFVQSGTPPGGAVKTYGMSLSATNWANSVGAVGAASLTGFDYPLLVFQSTVIATNFAFDDAGIDAAQVAGGTAYLFGCTGKGAGSRGLVVSGGAQAFVGDTSGVLASWRKTVGVDSTADMVVATGGQIIKAAGTTILGGTNVPLNQPSSTGVVFDPAVVMNPRGIFSLETYTVATAPSAAAYTRPLIFVSDGNGGQACLAVPFGGEWKRVVLGATISA